MIVIQCQLQMMNCVRSVWRYIVLHIFVLSVVSYNLKCPPQADWKFRAHVKCNSTKYYFCLYNSVEEMYVEGCNGPDWDRKGSKRIFAGSFSRDKCIPSRYQPFTFWTNESLSDCVFTKTKCNEEGQLLYKDVSAHKDRACRCDYKKGYSFIKVPRHVCFCIPSEEDCSCYIKSCPVNFSLSTDYSCIESSGINGNSTCIAITGSNGTIDENTGVDREKNSVWSSQTTPTLTSYSSFAAVFVVFLLPIGGFIIAVFFHKRNIEIGKPFNRYQLSRTGEQTTEEVNFLRMIHLLFRVACPAVRLTFDNEIQPYKLQEVLHENKIQMRRQYRNKKQIINDFQWNLLYRKSTVTSDDFDIGLMVYILKTVTNIKIGNLYPVSTDTSYNAMISRITYIRNETTQKLEGKLSAEQFNTYWDDVGQAVLKLVSAHPLDIDNDQEKIKLLGRFLALNPINIDNKKLCNFIDLSERQAAFILQQLISEYCTHNNITIEDMLRINKHELFHKRFKTTSCCACALSFATYRKVITEHQWKALYEMFDSSDSHVCVLNHRDCCERFVPKRIDTCDLSVSLILILNIPDMLTYTVRNLYVHFDKFLKQYQHEICHYIKGKVCCKCDKVLYNKKVIDSSQLENLFIKTNNSPCHTGIMDCCCQYSVRKGIEYTNIDDIILSKILSVAGPLSVLNRIEDDAFLYFLTWTVDDSPLLRALMELLNGIQDKKFYYSMKPAIRKQSNATRQKQTDARRWISRHLGKQKATIGQQLHIMVRDEDGFNVKTVQIPNDVTLPHITKKFTDITTEENNFLIVVYGLSKVVYPLLKREFNRNCPEEVLDKIRMDVYEQQTQDDENKSRKERIYLTLNQQQQLFSPKGEKSENLDLELMIYILKEISGEKGKKEYVDQLYVIDAIRREIIQSSSGVLTETRFQEVFKCIRKAVLCLGGHLYEKKLSELQDIRNILK